MYLPYLSFIAGAHPYFFARTQVELLKGHLVLKELIYNLAVDSVSSWQSTDVYSSW